MKMKTNEPLAPHTSLKIGGAAKKWLEPQHTESLRQALRMAYEDKEPIYVLGGGSNILIPDEGFHGLVIHLSPLHFGSLSIEGNRIVAGGAVPLSTLISFLVDHELGGCEFLMGIPAQVGGAICMNAGSARDGIGSHVTEVTVVGFDGQVRKIRGEELEFGYRKSNLRSCVLTEAVLSFSHVPKEKTLKNLRLYSDQRRQTQDLRFPNAGCMFQNPSGHAAGQLIEDAGLKGQEVGRARISDRHANFVMNLGGASFEDVLNLLELAERKVLEKFDVKLQRELRVMR